MCGVRFDERTSPNVSNRLAPSFATFHQISSSKHQHPPFKARRGSLVLERACASTTWASPDALRSSSPCPVAFPFPHRLHNFLATDEYFLAIHTYQLCIFEEC
jgi:hypothetical protein